MGKIRLSKYEKETIILSSEGDTTYSVYTYNPALKRRFAEYSKKYPKCCYLEWEDRETGSQTYVIDKARMSIRLTAPYSEERRKAASKRAIATLKESGAFELLCKTPCKDGNDM